MGVSRALGYAATVAAGCFLTPSAGAQSTTNTTCSRLGSNIVCRSETKKSPAPLDMADVMRRAQDLVPQYVPPAAPRPAEPVTKPHDEERRVDYFFSGGGLLKTCSASTLSDEWLICAAFIHAISTTTPSAITASGGKQPFCITREHDLFKLIDLVKAELSRNPSFLKEDAGALVFVMLSKRFPCEGK